MSSVNIPCGMVRDVSESVSLPHLDQRGLKIPISLPKDLPVPSNETARIMNAGFMMEKDGPGVAGGPPAHGADTESVLAMLGYNEDEICDIIDGSGE